MLAMARTMAPLCAWIRQVLTHPSGTAEKLTACESREFCRGCEFLCIFTDAVATASG
jgi:hypothetical protein